MAVYVDDARLPFGRMLMCHMMADTHEELVGMADRIGVARKWIQEPGTPWEHFDIALGKRALAVKAGAVEVTTREQVRLVMEKLEGLEARWSRVLAEYKRNISAGQEEVEAPRSGVLTKEEVTHWTTLREILRRHLATAEPEEEE